MITWKVKTTARLLTEVKTKFSGQYSVKDIRWSIDHNRCFVNEKVERFGSATVKPGDFISIHVEKPPSKTLDKTRILFEDEHLLVYDKPPHLTSEQLGSITSFFLVHRLDRDTSGVILLAKTLEAQKKIENQFRARTIEKEYLAIVVGDPGRSGDISGNMAPRARWEGAVVWGMSSTGQYSQTHWERLSTLHNLSLVRCNPVTGRTHQIRVHLAHIGYPVLGDVIYGVKKQPKNILRPLLHAHKIALSHPLTHTPLSFEAPLPADFLAHNMLA